VILDANDVAIIIQPATNVKVRNNYISDSIDNSIFIQHADDCEVSGNIIINAGQNGIRVRYYNTDSGENKDVSIHHNIIIGANQDLSFWAGIYLQGYDGSGNPFEIYANTIYDSQGDAAGEGEGIRVDLDDAESSGNIDGYVMNNISRDNNSDGICLEGDYLGSVTIYHGGNCNYNNGGVAIDDGNGWGDNSGFAANITTDPDHIDEANDDFRLNRSSPCIGTGDNQFSSLHGGPHDMGAVEFGAPIGARLRNGKYFRLVPASGVVGYILQDMER
jgi:hypothetical protein